MDRPQDRLALIECFEREGRAARVLDVWQWPLSLGRALDNHLVLDDPFVAAHHACIEAPPEGGLRLQVLHTTNGVRVDGRWHGAGASVALPAQGATLQIGNSPLRLRLPGETLAPEKPLPTHGSAWMPLALGALLYASVVTRHGIGLDPGAEISAWLPAVLGMPALVAGWCAVWALMSKLFRHRFDFSGHLRIVLPWLLGIEASEILCQQLGAMLGWPWLWRLASPAVVVLLALLMRAHLLHVLPQHGRSLSAALAAALAVGGGISLHLTYRATDRLSRPAYMSTLPLPALHQAARTDAARLVQDMAPIAEALARRVQRARDDEAENGEDDGGE